MKIQIDLKSALFGLVTGVLVILTIGATDLTANPVGRYQVASGSGFVTVLDTATGQVWNINLAGQNFTGTTPGFYDKKMDK